MAGEAAGQPDGRLAALTPGSVVAGRYRLERTISAGGMASVLPARDELLGERVALKVVPAPSDAGQEWRSRFLREMRAVASVHHPSVIPVLDVLDGLDDTMFVVMPFVPGRTLSEVLAREGPLSTGRTADVVSAVASALDEVHRAGLVHRDVKPSNILLESRSGLSEHVYLVDFGIATLAADLSEPGQFLGTPGYVAPEQIQGHSVDGRADQYALAVTAFTLLTGEPPFRHDDTMAMLYAHLSESPLRATSLRSDLPAGIDSVLARALAKTRDERFGSAGEFAEALRTALMTSRPATDSEPPAAQGEAEPALPDELLRASDRLRGPAGSRRYHDRDDVPAADQRTWDEALDDFPSAGSGGQPRHPGDLVPASSQSGGTSPPEAPDAPDAGSRPRRRSWVQAFTDGLGGIFDIFGGAQRQRWRPPAFEDTLAEDARALCLELGLIPQDGNGSREGTN